LKRKLGEYEALKLEIAQMQAEVGQPEWAPRQEPK
jgi:hypothetical protein